ncbi:MAG: phosphoglycolate phosphatase, partial [Methanomassiliicoccales archaeon]|nr:phosphoglycolate phosphatase [Methanomassiliicoccales archaeon]
VVKAVVVDVDGTITDSKRLIQSNGIEALRQVQQKGVTVMLSSGNVLPIAHGLSVFIGLKGPVIAENGGVVSFKEDVYKLNSNWQPLRAFEFLRTKLEVERLFTDRWRESEVALKKTVDTEAVREVLKDWNVVIETTGFAIHIMEPGHSKMNGVRKASELIGVKTKDIAAIGDSDNDVSMLKGCGFGIAVANASSTVKEVATYVCSKPHSDGVIEGLQWLGLL